MSFDPTFLSQTLPDDPVGETLVEWPDSVLLLYIYILVVLILFSSKFALVFHLFILFKTQNGYSQTENLEWNKIKTTYQI